MIIKSKASVAIGMALFIVMSPAYSNDSVATVAAGGIQLKKTAAISMDSEALVIRLDKITVNYQFYNHTAKAIEETIAFPLPAVGAGDWPAWDEEYIARKFLQANPGERNLKNWMQFSLTEPYGNTPFTDFELIINQQRRPLHYQIQAINSDGKKITEELQKNNIPLSAAFLQGFEEAGELEREPALKAKLKKLKLLDEKGMPRWKTQTTYFWDQTFEPQRMMFVTHRYTPSVGLHHIQMKDSAVKHLTQINQLTLTDEKNFSNGWSDFCLSKSDEQAIIKRMQESKTGYIDYYEVKYILTTGANWSGPIKTFRLDVISPAKNTLIIGCWPAKMNKEKNGTLTTTIKNFTPKKDLRILFIN